MQKIAEEELGEEMMERVEVFRELLAKTPVDELEVHERPRVIFRVSEIIWLEAIVSLHCPVPRSWPNQNAFDQETPCRPQRRPRESHVSGWRKPVSSSPRS